MSKTSSGKSHEEAYAAIQQKLSSSRRPEMSLVRAPSMPPCFETIPMAKGSDDVGRRKSKEESPDLPEEIQDEEVEFSMGRLIRQASLKTSEGSRMKLEYDRRKLERLRPRRVLKTQKSSSDLVWDELKSFKDLGFKNFNQEEERPAKKSPEEDMKAQIKFWARAVASNCAKNNAD